MCEDILEKMLLVSSCADKCSLNLEKRYWIWVKKFHHCGGED